MYFLCLLFVTASLSAQIPGSFKYIASQKDSCVQVSMDMIEVNNQYYLLTDMVTSYYYLERIPTITVFDESLNKIKEIRLFEDRVKIMPIKLFYKDNFFYLTGLSSSNGHGKPFLMKFDENFNIVQPLTAYALDDSSGYIWCHVIMNKDNDFIYLLCARDFSHNRLLHIGNDGVLRQDVSS